MSGPAFSSASQQMLLRQSHLSHIDAEPSSFTSQDICTAQSRQISVTSAQQQSLCVITCSRAERWGKDGSTMFKADQPHPILQPLHSAEQTDLIRHSTRILAPSRMVGMRDGVTMGRHLLCPIITLSFPCTVWSRNVSITALPEFINH